MQRQYFLCRMAPLHSQGCEGAAYPRLETRLQSLEKTSIPFPPRCELTQASLGLAPSIPTSAPGAAGGQGGGQGGLGGAQRKCPPKAFIGFRVF